MTDKQLQDVLKSMGLACFTRYYRQFCDLSLSPNDIAQLMIDNREPWTTKQRRAYMGRNVILKGREEDALIRIVGSRADSETRQQAEQYLEEFKMHQQHETTKINQPVQNHRWLSMNSDRDSFISDNFERLVDAFRKIDLEGILENYSDQDCWQLASPLLTASNRAKDNHLRYLSLTLLYEICSTRMNPCKPGNPFNDNFSDVEIDFFAEIVEYVENPFLKGRLADRVWNSPKYRGVEFARIAIDSYLSTPLTPDAWIRNAEDSWRRAIVLCKLIGEKSAENRLAHIKRSILKAIEEATTARGFYCNLMINTLGDNGLASDHSKTFAIKLESLAQSFDAEGNFHASGRHYSEASSWFKKAEMVEKATEMEVREAEAFEKEAMAEISPPKSSHMSAVTPLKSAVMVLLEIPKRYRELYNVGEKIRDLKSRISKYGQLALDEMSTYTIPGVDISNCVSFARSYVSDEPTWEAVVKFTNLTNVKVDNLRKSAKDTLSDYPLRRLFPTIGFESDGRVGGTIPGYDASASEEENKEVILDEMFRFHYTYRITVVTNGMILPALRILNAQHCLREVDFVDIARRSAIIPNDRTHLWGNALFSGFNFDFETSIHILAPQIENMVRWHLKSNGERTTNTNNQTDGRETENSLCTLMELAEVESIFGPDWTYEIRTLFCDRPGWNLRNSVAHGLLSDYMCSSDPFVYAWWFALKMVVNTCPPIETTTTDPNHSA